MAADTERYPDLRMGSIGGGGRYDNLTGVFGLNGVSGVGVSFGAERIYDVMQELGLFPEESASRLQLIFLAFDEESHVYAFRCLNEVRAAGINAELYPEPGKIKKQFQYADSRRVPYAAIVGSEEMQSGLIALKDLRSGEQSKLTLAEIINKIK